jgi:hypothetical protein
MGLASAWVSQFEMKSMTPGIVPQKVYGLAHGRSHIKPAS